MTTRTLLLSLRRSQTTTNSPLVPPPPLELHISCTHRRKSHTPPVSAGSSRLPPVSTLAATAGHVHPSKSSSLRRWEAEVTDPPNQPEPPPPPDPPPDSQPKAPTSGDPLIGSQLFPPVTSPTGPHHLKPTSSFVSSMNLSLLLWQSLTITAQDLDSRSTTQVSNYTHTGTATLASVYNRRQTWLQDPITPNPSSSETHSTTHYQQPPRFASPMSCYSAASLQVHNGVSFTAATNGYQIQPPAFQKRYGNRTLPLVSGELLLRSQFPAHLSDVTTLFTVDRSTIPVRVCGENPSRGTLFNNWATPDMGLDPQLALRIQKDLIESNKSISSQEPTPFKTRTETGFFKTALVAAISLEFQHLQVFLDF